MLPNACWRPQHVARLDGTSVELRSEAVVWQNTGEDWHDVSLVFSTERPARHAEPPTLEADVLAVQKKSAVVSVEAREERIETTGLGQGGTVSEVPGVDDGGEVQKLAPTGRVSVRSIGRPHRFPVQTFVSEAELSLRCAAELTPAVVRRAVLTNAAATPLLAGPVELLRHAGLAGRTRILFVAPRERFELGFGPEADLRVHRERETLDPEDKLLSSWIATPYRVRLKLSNLGATSHTVEVVERVPVSEIDKVTVTVDPKKTSQAATPDKDGHVRWTVTVPPHGHAALELAYTIKKHGDVVGL